VPVSLFFVTSEPIESIRAFVEGANIAPDGMINVDFRAIGIAATPTLVIVDSAGIVKRAFYGKLTEQNSRELLAIVEKAAL
jgi:hypothetical protein